MFGSFHATVHAFGNSRSLRLNGKLSKIAEFECNRRFVKDKWEEVEALWDSSGVLFVFFG